MPTPTEFIGEFQVNTGTANLPSASDPHIVGLSNGNFLVAWTESGTTGVAPEFGLDIVAKIFDAQGNLVRDTYRLNTVSTDDDEHDFDIAATNDGGFVLVYREDETSTQTDLNFQRHTASGNVATSDRIVTETLVGDSLSNPQISFDQINGTSLITYTANIAGNEDIFGVRVDSSGTVISGPYQAARNLNPDDDLDGDVAVLRDGGVVSVYEEIDGSDTSIEFRIHSPTGTQIVGATTVSGGGTDLDPQVTALAGGGFVVTWEANDSNNGEILYRVYDASGVSVAGPFVGSGLSNPNFQNEPEIVALPDGDFVILWDDDTSNVLIGQRFNSGDGGLDGDQFIIENANTTTPNIGVTGDGRLLFTWAFANNIWASVWDPRGFTINGDDYNQGVRNFVDTNVFTSLSTSSNVNGTSANDTILGQGGDDFLNGAAGGDTVFGGDGNDTFTDDQSASETEVDSYAGGNGIDTLIYTTMLSNSVEVNLSTGLQTIQAGVTVRDTFSSIENVIVAGSEGVIGNSADNVIIGTGTLNANFFDGGLGNDTLNGGGGNDVLKGGQGNDTVNGDSGDDTITDERFAGSADSDSYNGGSGIDTLIYTANLASSVTINLFTGQQTVTSGATVRDTITQIENVTVEGAETIIGDGSNNILTGTGAINANTFEGGQGADILNGGGGNDLLLGGFGIDSVNGEAGDDIIRILDGEFIDNVDGGTGADILDLSTILDDSVTIDMETGVFIGAGGTRTIAEIEEVLGTLENDVILGEGGGETLRGGGGDDTVDGRFGDDTLYGDAGDDSLEGGSGLDVLYGGTEDDIVEGKSGDDMIFGGSGVDRLKGHSGKDTVYGEQGADTIWGGESDDALSGGDGEDALFGGLGRDDVAGGSGADDLFGNEGDDLLRGGDGNDVISGGDSKDEIYGGGDDDTITGGNNVDNIRGQSGNDDIKGNRGNDVIRGGSGEDFIRGNDGRDTILGGDDNDDLRGGTGDDTIFGGNGDDEMLGGDGNDVLSGGAGNDVMTGGGQADFFEFRAGDDLVSVVDFQNNFDTIRIEATLNPDDLSNGAFLAEFGSIIDGNAVLNFGSDGTLTVQGVSVIGMIGNDLEFI